MTLGLLSVIICQPLHRADHRKEIVTLLISKSQNVIKTYQKVSKILSLSIEFLLFSSVIHMLVK